jgi:hypothetical protein
VFSKTGFVSIVTYLIMFGVPIFVTFMTNNYWISNSSYIEQPSVSHLNEIIVYLQTDSG